MKFKEEDKKEAMEAIQDIFKGLENLNVGLKHINHENGEIRRQARFEKELAEMSIKSELHRLKYLLEKSK